jgi:hypothetical protein
MRDRQSVLPVLEFLEHSGWIRYFHRAVATRDQFVGDISRWASQKRYSDYEVAFVATHGEPEGLWFGSDRVELSDLADELAGLLTGKIIYFGSCSTASDDVAKRSRRFKGVLQRFRRRTGATAVAGYVNDVDFEEAAAFELLLFSWLAEYRRRTYAFGRLRRDYPDLCRQLGFVADPTGIPRRKSR